MIVLITKADKKPATYRPREVAKIKIVVVPGQGIIPAESIN